MTMTKDPSPVAACVEPLTLTPTEVAKLVGISRAGLVIRTDGDSIFGGGTGATVLVSRMLGKRTSNGIFQSGGDGASRAR